MKPSIQRRVLPVLLAAALLGGCGPQGGDPDLEFPQTGWEMNAEQVMEAWGTTPEEVGNRTAAGRGTTFTLTDREVFGSQAEQITFSFLNLKPGETGDLQQFDAEALAGQEVLVGVWVQYPAGTDAQAVTDALNARYGDAALTELTVYPLFSALDTGAAAETLKADDTRKLWGSAPVASRLTDANTEFCRENWPLYRTELKTDADWDAFASQGRLVTIVCEQQQEGLSVWFNAYDLAVCNELTARQDA